MSHRSERVQILTADTKIRVGDDNKKERKPSDSSVQEVDCVPAVDAAVWVRLPFHKSVEHITLELPSLVSK